MASTKASLALVVQVILHADGAGFWSEVSKRDCGAWDRIIFNIIKRRGRMVVHHVESAYTKVVIVVCKPFSQIFCLIFDCNAQSDIFIIVCFRSWPHALGRVRIVLGIYRMKMKMMLTSDSECADFDVQSEAGLMLFSLPNKLGDLDSEGNGPSDSTSKPKGVKSRISSNTPTPMATRHLMLSCWA